MAQSRPPSNRAWSTRRPHTQAAGSPRPRAHPSPGRHGSRGSGNSAGSLPLRRTTPPSPDVTCMNGRLHARTRRAFRLRSRVSHRGTHASALAGVDGGALEFGSAGGTFAQRSGVKPGGKRGPVPEPASGAGDDLGRWHEADGAPSEDSWLGDSCEPGGSAHTEHPGGEPGPARERPVRPGVPPDQVCADAKLRPRWSSQGSPRGGPSPIA